MKFFWDPKYSVNIKSIDSQHQRFFEICNEINYLIHTKKTDSDNLFKVTQKLFDYAEMHLKYEEKYFRDLKFPEGDVHISIHNAFRQQIKNFQKELKKSKNTSELSSSIADFCRDWLSEHILATDHKYCQFFLAHDVK